MKQFVSICILLSFVITSFAQRYDFELFMLGSKIGELSCERKIKGDTEIYTITSFANAKILWKTVNSQSINRLIFKSGVLVEAYYEYKENDVVEKFCKTNVSATGYAVHNWKSGKFTYADPIKLGIAHFYFKEPSTTEKYYDDNWGVNINLKKSKEHVYEYKSPDGDKNVYYYTNGRISEAEFHTSIVVVKMRPKA